MILRHVAAVIRQLFLSNITPKVFRANTMHNGWFVSPSVCRSSHMFHLRNYSTDFN